MSSYHSHAWLLPFDVSQTVNSQWVLSHNDYNIYRFTFLGLFTRVCPPVIITSTIWHFSDYVFLAFTWLWLLPFKAITIITSTHFKMMIWPPRSQRHQKGKAASCFSDIWFSELLVKLLYAWTMRGYHTNDSFSWVVIVLEEEIHAFLNLVK